MGVCSYHASWRFLRYFSQCWLPVLGDPWAKTPWPSVYMKRWSLLLRTHFGARPTAMRQAMELSRGSLWTLSAPASLMSAEENPHLQPARAVGALGHLGDASG